MAKKQYKAEEFEMAASILELLIHEQKRRQVAVQNTRLVLSAMHLLGYCFLEQARMQVGHNHHAYLDKACRCFQSCVHMGYEDDWQLLVQLELDRSMLGLPVLDNKLE